MPENSSGNVLAKKLTSEDIVIVISIVISLLLAPLLSCLWFLYSPIVVPPLIIAIFLGIAVSALLYRFLGGVRDASFTIGTLKVTGTAAIPIGIAWWSNGELKQYVAEHITHKETFDISKHVIPSSEEWFAINKQNGTPIKLEFPYFNQEHLPPTYQEIHELRKGIDIKLRQTDNMIYAVLNSGVEQTLGKIEAKEINSIGYHNKNKIGVQLKPYRVVSFGAAKREDVNNNLPFLIETKGFSNNYTRFALISRDEEKVVYESAILLRGAEVVEYDDQFFLISIVQVNHNPTDSEPYAKIYIAKIILKYV